MSKKAVEKPLMFAALTVMAVADLYKLAGDHVKISVGVSTAQDKFTNSLKPFAKVVAAVKRCYVEMRENRQIALDIPFNKFFKDNVKGELPGRAESLATLFNSLVLTLDANNKPLLAEENFDAADATVDRPSLFMAACVVATTMPRAFDVAANSGVLTGHPPCKILWAISRVRVPLARALAPGPDFNSF